MDWLDEIFTQVKTDVTDAITSAAKRTLNEQLGTKEGKLEPRVGAPTSEASSSFDVSSLFLPLGIAALAGLIFLKRKKA